MCTWRMDQSEAAQWARMNTQDLCTRCGGGYISVAVRALAAVTNSPSLRGLLVLTVASWVRLSLTSQAMQAGGWALLCTVIQGPTLCTQAL